MATIKLTGLIPQAYEHPSDKSALDALANNGGLDKLLSKLHSWGFEQSLRIELTGSFLKVTKECFGDLFKLLETACITLDMPARPELYIAAGPLNAFTAGVEKPLIVIYSGLVEALTEEELLFVIAHELGHIKSAHVLYYQLAKFLPALAEQAAHFTFGLSEFVGVGVEMALLHWQRMSEYTADRAGLLGCQDAKVAFRTLMKLAGLPQKYYSKINTADFIAQAKTFEALERDKFAIIAKVLNMDASHPYTVMRAKQLLDWYDGGGYDQVLKNPQVLKRLCTRCSYTLKGTELFCPGCSLRLSASAGA